MKPHIIEVKTNGGRRQLLDRKTLRLALILEPSIMATGVRLPARAIGFSSSSFENDMADASGKGAGSGVSAPVCVKMSNLGVIKAILRIVDP
ncbi:hypothetical protein PanWU01x14_258110 [Parasponia andersonii]|uniref:Uncharacterized protein n=1 Tax=Parasponia andersonii TaxID=3476 RepID=A0A2P5B9S7_PARAD|nr:hypothetical protein PanWU01x14_258110 [Parasponia andersonii]